MFLFFLWFLNTYGPLIEPFRGDGQKAIERFKGDDTEVFPPGYF